jgi:hypothetical protein
MRHTATGVSGSIERRDDISARFPRATGWLYNQGILFAVVLLALLSALSGCGSGQSDVAQTNGNSVTTVTGTVTNAGSGAPLAGATVGTDSASITTTTDSNGNFTLTGVPPGPQTLAVSRSGFSPATKAVTMVAGTSVSAGAIALTPLAPFGTITGTVINATTGDPLAGATVTTGGIPSSVTTDTNGNFTLPGVPADEGDTLAVIACEFDPATKQVRVGPGQTLSVGTILLTPNPSNRTACTATNAGTVAPLSVGTVALTPLSTFGTTTGTVTNAGTGAPLSGVTVGGIGFSTTTDSNGNFTLAGVPPGPQTLTISRSGFSPAMTDVTVEPGKTLSTGTIALTPLSTFGTTTGTVTNAGTDAPLSGATVGGIGFSATTDSNGNFTLAGVPPGPQTLTISRSGFSPATKLVPVIAGETVSAGTIALLPVIVTR